MSKNESRSSERIVLSSGVTALYFLHISDKILSLPKPSENLFHIKMPVSLSFTHFFKSATDCP